MINNLLATLTLGLVTRRHTLLKGLLVPFFIGAATVNASGLSPDLTPTGAIAKGSTDGLVPAWVADKKEADRIQQALASETPQLIINGSNFQQHVEYLTDGQIALFNKYPNTYEMPVYQSHRLHHVPDWLKAATIKNKADAQLIDNGNGITNVWPGQPFPEPKNAHEVLWNHLTAWRGISLKGIFLESAVHPKQDFYITKTDLEIAMPFYQANREAVTDNIILNYYLTRIVSPPRIAGGAILVHDSMNAKAKQRQSWIYNASQRRVRRLPFLGYDTPNMISDDIRVVDDFNLFNGSPDRYDWKLIGKRIVYIPYNAVKMANASVDFKSLLTPYHLKTNATRFELHRVWELEATLKEDAHHIYTKRKLFLDEDSWITVLSEQYNNNGELWRVSHSHTQYIPEMPGVMKVGDVFHDLKTHSYYAQALLQRNGKLYKFSEELPEKSRFSPIALKRYSKR
jgi:hypothetical protein